MIKYPILLAPLAAMALFIACGEETIQVETESTLDEAVTVDADTATPLYTLVDVAYTDLSLDWGSVNIDRKRYEIFRDKTAFEAFLAQLEESAEVPTVDFDKDMIIALYNGTWSEQRPLYTIDSIKKMVPDDIKDIHYTVLFVETTTLYRSDKLPANQAFYHPIHIIKVEKAEFVNFNDRFVIERSY
ncbi:MAG TPA: hypothetical protein P5077_02910 [bacterium]|nr:hypothetical protein [bacterium]